MTFISHAQNYEDVMLWRALKQVECGFYVDVGASDPHAGSVTKAFYERGWSGINIEPIQNLCETLQQARGRDVNLNLAASAQEGELLLFDIPDAAGLATLDKTIAERHRKEFGYQLYEKNVATKTLTQICRENHSGTIHFLKIDVEGAEKQVIEGLDLSQIRPWIIVVESTLPFTQVETHLEWESLLTTSDYTFVYFDGLNRFYVAEERKELRCSFNAPPNFFDHFVKVEQYELDRKAREAIKRLEDATSEAHRWRAEAEGWRDEATDSWRAEATDRWRDEADRRRDDANRWRDEADRWRDEADRLTQELQAVYASNKWRATWPLRQLNHESQSIARRLTRKAKQWHLDWPFRQLNHECRSIVRRLTRKAKQWHLDWPLRHLRHECQSISRRLTRKLKKWFRIRPTETVHLQRQEHFHAASSFTPSARRTYYELQSAIKSHKKEPR